MDFILQREFFHPEVQSKTKRKRTAENIFIASYAFSPKDQFLFVGLTNGKISFWKKKNMDQKFLTDKGKEPELIEIESPQHHKGEVRCLIYSRIEGLDVLISGSADRTIKLWEPKNTKSNPCFQTIIGHGGTIMSMAFIQKVSLLVTSSTDRTMRIWRIDKARQLLMYPWFVPLQIIKDFTSINTSLIDNTVWVQCFDIKEGENLSILAGDSEGSYLTFKAPENWRTDCIFELARKTPSIHRIGIIQVLLVAQANFIFTISFDQQLKGFDATNNNEFLCIKNPNKVIYTSIFWDNQYQELYIADECGFLWVLNVYMEKPLIQKKLFDEKVRKIEITEDTRNLLVHTEYGIRVYKVKRGQKTQDMLGHQGPILKIITLDPQKLEKITKERIPDEPKIISCSLDNTIRFWDAKEMNLITQMDSPEHSELSCMTYLINCCLVATGHEDGAIRLWNLEINSSVTLRNESYNHSNSISCIQGIIWKDSEYLLCGSYDGKVSIWEISEKRNTGQNSMLSSTIFPQLRQVIDNTKNPYENKFDGSEILSLLFYQSDQASYILVGGNNKNVNIWSIRTGEYIDTLREHSDSVTCMAIEQNMLFTGSDDKTIVIWDLVNMYMVGKLEGHQETVQDLIILQETGLLLSCSYDKSVIVWKYETKSIIEKIEKQEELRCMDYISSTKMLFIGTNQKNILTINIEKLLDYHINLLDFNPDDQDFNLNQELSKLGFSPGINMNDVLSNQQEVTNIDDMKKIEQLLQELKMKEQCDKEDPINRTEFLEEQEKNNDEDLKLLLQEQEKILKQDKAYK